MVMLQSGRKTESVLVRDPSGFTGDKNGVHCESLMVVDGDVKKSVEQVDVRTLKKRVLQSGRKTKSVLVPDASGFTGYKNGVHYESLMVVDGYVKKSVQQVDVRTLKKCVSDRLPISKSVHAPGSSGFIFYKDGVQYESTETAVADFENLKSASEGHASMGKKRVVARPSNSTSEKPAADTSCLRSDTYVGPKSTARVQCRKRGTVWHMVVAFLFLLGCCWHTSIPDSADVRVTVPCPARVVMTVEEIHDNRGSGLAGLEPLPNYTDYNWDRCSIALLAGTIPAFRPQNYAISNAYVLGGLKVDNYTIVGLYFGELPQLHPERVRLGPVLPPPRCSDACALQFPTSCLPSCPLRLEFLSTAQRMKRDHYATQKILPPTVGEDAVVVPKLWALLDVHRVIEQYSSNLVSFGRKFGRYKDVIRKLNNGMHVDGNNMHLLASGGVFDSTLGFPGEGPGPDAVAVPRQSSRIKAKVKASATAAKKWLDYFSMGPAIAAGSSTAEGVLEDASMDAMVNMNKIDDCLRTEDLHLHGVEDAMALMHKMNGRLLEDDVRRHGVETAHRQTYRPGSKAFDDSLPASSFDVTLKGGGHMRGWVTKSVLRSLGLYESVSKLFKKGTKSDRNTKRTSAMNKESNDKRTPAKRKEGNDKRTPAELDAIKLRMRERREEEREFNGLTHEKLLVAMREGMESDAYNWPNALLQDPGLDRESASSISGNPEMECGRKYQSKINNAALEKCACAVCWELTFKKTCEYLPGDDPETLWLLDNLRTLGVVHEKADFTFPHPFDAYDGIPLLAKCMNVENSAITVCSTCLKHLRHDDPEKRLPPRSVANDLWFGEQTKLMTELTLTAKLLISPVRQKAYIVKLKAKAKPSTLQRAVLGSTIAFPQENVLMDAPKLPHDLSELPRSLSIIFVGSKLPSEAQLSKVFRVNATDLESVLNEFRANGHIGFRYGSWNMEELQTHEANNGTTLDLINDCVNTIDAKAEEAVTRETRSYAVVNNRPDGEVESEDDEYESDDENVEYEDGEVVLHSCGLVNSNGVAEDREERDHRALDALRVGHHEDPVNTYGNPEYWVNSMPWLFPFGAGGAEADRPRKLTLSEWVRHCLNYHDDRFRKDPGFIFIVYKCLQVRDRVTMTNVLFKTSINQIGKEATNAVSVADFTYALDVLQGKKTLFGCDADQVRRVKALLQNIKIIGRQSPDSVYARDACRSKMMGLVTAYNLPSLFITLNPSDIYNPMVSFWHNAEGTAAFDLDTLLPKYPTADTRRQIVADDPVNSSEMFDTVINAFMESFLGFEEQTVNGLTGKLVNSSLFTGDAEYSGLQAAFGTVECQGRGSLHIHLLVWLTGIPTSKEMMKRINEGVKQVKELNNPASADPTCPPSVAVPARAREQSPTASELAYLTGEDTEMAIPEIDWSTVYTESYRPMSEFCYDNDDVMTDVDTGDDVPSSFAEPQARCYRSEYADTMAEAFAALNMPYEPNLRSSIAEPSLPSASGVSGYSVGDDTTTLTSADVDVTKSSACPWSACLPLASTFPYSNSSKSTSEDSDGDVLMTDIDISHSVVPTRDDYLHRNPPADGLCSLHATADVIGLSLDDTVAEFKRFVEDRRVANDVRKDFPLDHPEVRTFIASQRTSATALTYYSDEELYLRFKHRLDFENEDLQALCSDVHKLLRDPSSWRGSNAAAKGSEAFCSFIEHYYESKRAVTVKAVSLKVAALPDKGNYMSNEEVHRLLHEQHFFENASVLSLFNSNQLVIFVEVGEAHFHSLVPQNLLVGVRPLNVVSSLKRKKPWATNSIPWSFPASKRPKPTSSLGGDQPDISSAAQNPAESVRSAPSSPWLQPNWLTQVIRCLESYIQQDYPRFHSSEKEPARSDDISSETPGYFHKRMDPDVAHNKFKSDVCHLATSCNTHKCQMKGTCTKYGTKKCRFDFPRPIVMITGFEGGVIQLKRLDTNCNNYNRAVLASLRCNMDIKFITNGQDARAAIFYITDYITKSELSSYESLSLIQLALAKVEKNEFLRSKSKHLSEAEDNARRRIWTSLNVIDAHVERSSQWCCHGLMGRPYEYTTHLFCSFNVHAFVGYLSSLANCGGEADVAAEEYTLPSFKTGKNKEPKIVTTSKRIDYTHRTGSLTDRYKIPDVRNAYLHQNCATAAETVAELSPYEFHFRAKKMRTPLIKNKKGRPVAYVLKAHECALHPDHPQFDTHHMTVKNASNPKKPHVIPNMLGYVLPNIDSDPEKYYLIMMALFSPYHSSDNMLGNPYGADYASYEESFDGFMGHLADYNPIKHAWLKRLMANMNTIREGKVQQQKERAKREELKQAQGLIEPDAEGPYDHNVDDVADSSILATEEEMADVLRSIKHRYKSFVSVKERKLVSLLSDRANLHPSKLPAIRDGAKRRPYAVGNSESIRSMKETMEEFDKEMLAHKEMLYAKDDVNSTVARPPFKSASALAAEMGLDQDQRDAFFLCARQTVEKELFRRKLSDKEPEQLILYLGGEGGTGKSAVLRALTTYMTSIGVRNQMRLGSQTGVAAGNIGGSTLHSLLRLPMTKKEKLAAKALPDSVFSNFKDVTLFFIDEISMTGCEDLNTISTRLKDAKSNVKSPFGGIDVIFAGDFYQLPPTGGAPLYSQVNVSRETNTTKSSLGYALFRMCTHAIFLTQQHRMSDATYKDFVTRFRYNDPLAEKGDAKLTKTKRKEDEQYLLKRVISKRNPLSTGHLSHLKEDPVIIVQWNKLRYHINNAKAKQHAAALGEKLLINVAIDKSQTSISSIVRKDVLLYHECSNTDYGAGLLPLFIGMVVMTKRNIGTELGISNGSTGVITDIVVDPRETIDYDSDEPHFLRHHPLAVYVRIDAAIDKTTNEPEVKFKLTGLPANVFIMTRERNKKDWPFCINLEGNQLNIPYPVHMKREQYAILPAYCITVNSSQGRTLQSAVVCLEGSYSQNVKPYVMLSRLTNGSSLGVIGSWPGALFSLPPNRTMLYYLEEYLHPLAEQTTFNLDHSLLVTLENTLRNGAAQ